MLYEVITANEVMDTERLTIPHYGMREREFVLYPLAEISPSLQLPDGTMLEELLKTVPRITSYNVCYTKLLRNTRL